MARARFYEGAMAEKLVAALRAAGGVMTLDDLKNYRADAAHAGARQLSRL